MLCLLLPRFYSRSDLLPTSDAQDQRASGPRANGRGNSRDGA